MKNVTVRTASIQFGYLILIGTGFMVGKDMLDKPFKISHVADFYASFAIYGTAIALVVSLAASWLLGRKIPTLLAPVVPNLIFPFTLWAVYQIAFLISGNEVGFERSDLSPLTAELELAYILIQYGTLGMFLAVAVAGIAIYIERR